jgi:SSS family solute:Na+ symporter
MQFLDWLFVGGSLLLVFGIGVSAQRYMKSVADFMSAGRGARRYLLAVAKGEMAAGAVVFVAAWEAISHSGFTNGWWGWIGGPIGLFVVVTGFVIYRYRETRALTLGQFFEIRYSKPFRLFAGMLGVVAGLLNFGIIPAVGARFMVYFLGLPEEWHFFGAAIPTFILLMGIFLLINLFITLTGGLITIMITNCMEGIVSQLLYLVVIFGLLSTFHWSQINQVLSDRPPGQSLLNPMDSLGLKDFNIWFVLMMLVVNIYGTMAWQNQSSYQSAPLTAHEARMGGLLSRWREMGKWGMVTLLGICAITYLHHPDFAAGAALVQTDVAKISNPQIQEQMEIPIAITHLLPAGVKGALCATLLLGIFGGDSNHLHSWGSLFIQDVIMPFRKKLFTPRQHILLLRISMTGIALFAFLFGSLFRQTEYIQMWWSITQSIYMGGAGAAIIGGLYWKKGTTAGAWAGVLTGTLLSAGGIVLKQLHGAHWGHFLKQSYVSQAGPLPPLVDSLGNLVRNAFLYFITFNGLEIAFYAMLAAVAVYVAVSLLTCRENFNLDRMLHRGIYAVIRQEVGEVTIQPQGQKITWGKIIGYDENFSTADKWIAGALFAWTMLFFVIMAVGTIWNLIQPWPLPVWSEFWHIAAIGIPIFFAVVTGVWFTWGGVSDTLDLFRRLRAEQINPMDNGVVIDHQNLDESVLPDAISPIGMGPSE